MLKLKRALGSRHQLSQSVSCRKAGVGGNVWNLHGSTNWAGISTATDNHAAKGYVSDRIYAPYNVYKGKAALSLSPCLPTFTKLQSGTVILERRGSMMMTFWPAIGERKYDWEKRQRFALSATEVGSLISVGPKDSCEFFHDPAMLSSNAGQVRKSLSIKPYGDGTGYFVSLTVVNNILKTKDQFSIPVTTAEFAVMRTACSFALPHIMGWDRMTNQRTSGMVGHQLQSAQQSLDLEWEK